MIKDKYNVIILTYFVLSYFIFNFFNLPSLLSIMFSLIGFVLLPFLISGFLVFILNKFSKINISLNIFSYLIFSWSLGMLGIIIISLILSNFGVFNPYLLFFCLILLNLVNLLFLRPKSRLDISVIHRNKDLIPLFILFTLIPFFIYSLKYTPFPYFPTTDVFNMTRSILIATQDGILDLATNYLPFLWINSSTVSIIWNVEPFIFVWASKFIFTSLFSIGVYLFSYSLSKNKLVSLTSSLIAIIITITDLNPLYYFGPRSIFYIIFPFYLYFINTNIIKINNKTHKDFEAYKKNKVLFFCTLVIFLLYTLFLIFIPRIDYLNLSGLVMLLLFLLIIFATRYINREYKTIFLYINFIFIFLISIHLLMGIIGILIIVLLILFNYLYNHYYNILKYFSLFFLLLSFIFILLQHFDIVTFDAINLNMFNLLPEVSPYLKATYDIQYNLLVKTFPIPLISLIIGGICISFFFDNKISNLIYSNILVLQFLIFFLPISHIYRMLYLMVPIAAYLSSLFVCLIVNSLRNRFKSFNLGIIFYIFIILLIVVNPIISNQISVLENISKSSSNGIVSTYDSYEYEAYIWIKENIPKNTIIFSDRQTMIQVNGISNNIYLEVEDENIPIFQSDVKSIFNEEDSSKAYSSIKELLKNSNYLCNKYDPLKKCNKYKNTDVIIIIGEKASNFAWTGQTQWYVRDFRYFEGFTKFFDKQYFTPLYGETGKIYVFGLNPDPGVPFKLDK